MHVSLFGQASPDSQGKSYPYPGFADEDTEGESGVTGPQSHSQLAVELGSKCQSVGGKLAVRSAIWDSVFLTACHNSPSRCEIGLGGRASSIIRGAQGETKTRGSLFKEEQAFSFLLQSLNLSWLPMATALTLTQLTVLKIPCLFCMCCSRAVWPRSWRQP